MKTGSTTKSTSRPLPPPPWHASVLACALLGALLMWAALPPLDLWPLGWIAPIPWLVLIVRRELGGATQGAQGRERSRRDDPPAGESAERSEKLPVYRRLRDFFTRPYPALWLAGFLFWLLAIHWLRLPHWATHFGWLALAFYLAFYVPVFVGLARIAVHQAGISLLLAAPVVWTGLELARAHLLTGFLMGALGHTQYRWLELIQISDLGGGYAVSFLVMLAAACVARMLPVDDRPPAYWPLVPLVVVLGGALLYGGWRMNHEAAALPGPRVALIQGSIDADWKQDPDKGHRIFTQYYELSQQALRRPPRQPIDVVVWPETMYRRPYITFSDDFQAPPGQERTVASFAWAARHDLAQLAERLDTALLLGLEAIHATNEEDVFYNSAVAVDARGRILGRYDKIHRVMFGEYVPLATYFPWLYRLSPMGGGIAAGQSAVAFEINEVRYAPNICFESVIPHVIRRQVRELASEGDEPDVLVNLTNDAWFWGSSELDMHLACGVFRAVEARKPFLAAANGGISAAIDGNGRILSRSPKRALDVIVLDVPLDGRESLYMRIGDVPAGTCLAAAMALAAFGAWRRRRTVG